MKKIIKKHGYYFKFFFIILFFVFLSACNGITPAEPVIHSFTADVYILNEGDSAILSWVVTDATTVTINPGIGNVSLSGSTSVTPTETTTYTLTATNTAGTNTATVTITVNPVMVEYTITIQPGPQQGKDASVNTVAPSDNYGNYNYLSIGNYAGQISRSFLQFDLSSLPVDVVIVDAYLKLFPTNPGDCSISLYQVTEGWEENTITWNNQPEFLTTPEDTLTIPVIVFTWISWDITSLLQEWVDGSIDNYGIILKKDIELPMTNDLIQCYSSDSMFDPTLRPKLETTYYIP